MRDHGDAVEADLQRYYNVDYRDRWRGRLSLRRIHVLVHHLPAESATLAAANHHSPGWTVEAHLLDVLRMTMVHSKDSPAKPHPARPMPAEQNKDTPERRRKVADFRRRQAARQRDIDAGLIH